ncbi:MAG: hypothetical protein HDT29_06120 [Clostridiales bacterium]|nr:hypothetical protein [Clostridiales bacterium]
MIKQGLKNYVKNLKYFFTPLGALALGVVFGLSIGLPIVLKSLSDLLDMVVQISQNTQIRFQDLIAGIIDKVDSLDWDNPIKALSILLDRTWLTDTISGCVESISIDMAQLESYINGCIDDIVVALRIFIFFVILGFVGGYFITKWLIRREIAKRALWKYFLVSFVDSLLSATLVSFCLWILALWRPSIFISTLVSMMLFGSIQLFEAYIVHAWKKVDIKKVINVKNIAKLYLVDILIFAIAVVLVGIVIAITNTLVGLFVGIALIEIAFIIIGLNAEAYVKNVAGIVEEKTNVSI